MPVWNPFFNFAGITKPEEVQAMLTTFCLIFFDHEI